MSAFTNFILIGKLATTPEETSFGSDGKKIKFRIRCELPDKISFYDITAFGDFMSKTIKSFNLDEEMSISGRLDSRVSDKGYLFLDLVARDIVRTGKVEKSFSFATDKPRKNNPPTELRQEVMFTDADIPF